MRRTWTIIGVGDVPGSFKWYQSLLGLPSTWTCSASSPRGSGWATSPAPAEASCAPSLPSVQSPACWGHRPSPSSPQPPPPPILLDTIVQLTRLITARIMSRYVHRPAVSVQV